MKLSATDKLAAFLALMTGVRTMLEKHPKDLPVVATLAADPGQAHEVLRFSLANTNVVDVRYTRHSSTIELLAVDGAPVLEFMFKPDERKKVFPEVIEVIYQRLTRGIERTP